MLSFYELMGVFANLLGGIAGSQWGLKFILVSSLLFQVAGIAMLAGLRTDTWDRMGVIVYVTAAQTLSGVAKDLVKLSGKNVIKLMKAKKSGKPDRRRGRAR